MGLPIPSMMLKQLYTRDSLKNTPEGVRFALKNRLTDTTVTAIHTIKFDGQEVPRSAILARPGQRQDADAGPGGEGTHSAAACARTWSILCQIPPLALGKHAIEVKFDAATFGTLNLKVDGSIVAQGSKRIHIPRDRTDDYSPAAIQTRQAFVEEFAGNKLNHIKQYSFDPHILQGNVEHFIGVAQIPIGLAGPLTIHGEHAQGDFLIPMATTEGTLVASYNRGMKVLNLSGGVKVTVIGDAMQRAPVFVFDSAVEAREFVKWVQANLPKIAEEAESTSSVAKLQNIDPYLAAKFAYLRFNYSTGDAAGQNMVGRATFAACSWILDNYEGVRHFYLESNLATDKKASQVNIMHTRGKRVVAEAVVKREVLIEHMRVEPESLAYHYGVSQIGAVLSGANNNGPIRPMASPPCSSPRGRMWPTWPNRRLASSTWS